MAERNQFYADNQELFDNLPKPPDPLPEFSGVTITQYGEQDSRFPGWQVKLGPGIYKGGEDFPNDDASGIQIDDGFEVTLREHGPSDERYPGEEIQLSGPYNYDISGFLGSIGNIFNNKLSEIEIVEKVIETTTTQGNTTSDQPPLAEEDTEQSFISEADNRVEETYKLSYNTDELKFDDSEHSVIDMRETNNIITIDLRSVVYKPEPFSEVFDIRIKSY